MYVVGMLEVIIIYKTTLKTLACGTGVVVSEYYNNNFGLKKAFAQVGFKYQVVKDV